MAPSTNEEGRLQSENARLQSEIVRHHERDRTSALSTNRLRGEGHDQPEGTWRILALHLDTAGRCRHHMVLLGVWSSMDRVVTHNNLSGIIMQVYVQRMETLDAQACSMELLVPKLPMIPISSCTSLFLLWSNG